MYSVRFTPDAWSDLQGLDALVGQRILGKLRWLAENCDAVSHQSLSGPLGGYFKLRVGDYRVLYSLDRRRRRIAVHLVDHRRRIYKRR